MANKVECLLGRNSYAIHAIGRFGKLERKQFGQIVEHDRSDLGRFLG